MKPNLKFPLMLVLLFTMFKSFAVQFGLFTIKTLDIPKNTSFTIWYDVKITHKKTGSIFTMDNQQYIFDKKMPFRQAVAIINEDQLAINTDLSQEKSHIDTIPPSILKKINGIQDLTFELSISVIEVYHHGKYKQDPIVIINHKKINANNVNETFRSSDNKNTDILIYLDASQFLMIPKIKEEQKEYDNDINEEIFETQQSKKQELNSNSSSVSIEASSSSKSSSMKIESSSIASVSTTENLE